MNTDTRKRRYIVNHIVSIVPLGERHHAWYANGAGEIWSRPIIGIAGYRERIYADGVRQRDDEDDDVYFGPAVMDSDGTIGLASEGAADLDVTILDSSGSVRVTDGKIEQVHEGVVVDTRPLPMRRAS